MKQKVKQFLKFRTKSNPQVESNEVFGSDAQSISNEFKNLTTNLNDSQSIDDCILFYNEKLIPMYPNNDEQLLFFLQTYDLVPNVTKLFEVYIPLFELSILDESKWANGFTFLQSSISYINKNDQIKESLYNFIFTIINSNNRPLLEISKNFFISFLNDTTYSEDILKGQNLVKIWKSVFMTNDITSQILGDSFINILPMINYEGIDDIQPLLDSVLLTLNKETSESMNLLPKSLEFISKIMRIIDTGTFIESLIDSIRSYLIDIPDLTFLKYLLMDKSNKVGIVWEVINHLFSNSATSMTKIRILIDIFKSVKNISKLKASSLLVKFTSFSNEDLQTILNIIKQQSNEYKFAFICNSCPPWSKHVTPDFFEKVLTSGSFDKGQIETILDIFIRSEESFFEYCHITQVKRSVYFLLSQMTNDMEIATGLLYTFLNQLNKSELKTETEESVKDMINKIFITGNHQYLTAAVVDFLKTQSNIKDRVFAVLAVEILNYDDVAILLRKNNVCNFIENYLDQISCVDFLASLANDGPCNEIDEFIEKINFEKSPLSKLENKYLTNLMLGLPHDSSYDGLVRITPLCKFIDEVPINTPFDRYMIANKLKKMNKKTFFKCSSFYIRSHKISLDSSYLREISNPEFFHFSVYQSHYSMRHSYAIFPSAITTSIWIYFEKLINETFVLSSQCFKVIVSLEEIRVNNNERFKFPLMEWHLLTVFRNNHTFGSKTIEIYLDDKKIADIECKNPLNEIIQIGSEDMNYAIWYIAQSIQTMNTQPMKNDLQNIIKAGPSAFSPIRLDCGPGLPYLHYRGILSFLNNFNIFSLILSSNNENDFVNYIYTANNLRKIGVISNDKYYSAIRYVSIQKELNNLNINLTKFKFEDFLHNIEFINDYQIIGLNSIKFDWMKKDVLNNSNLINECVNYLIDSLIFLKLDENKQDLFFEIINKHALNHPEFINKIFMIIEVVPDNIKLQTKLYEIFSKNLEIFQSQVQKQRLYQLLQNIEDDELVLKILDYLSPQHYDLNCLEESSIRFILLVKYESFWLSMFSFLIGTKITDSIESSSPYPVKQQNMFPLMIKLVVFAMKFEISNLVLRILLFLLNKVQIGNYIDSVRCLCSLGYRNQIPTKYPFRLRNNINSSANESANTSRRSSIQIDFNSNNDNLNIDNSSQISPLDEDLLLIDQQENIDQDEEQINFENSFANAISKIDYKNIKIQPLSQEFYDETLQYLNENFKFNDDLYLFKNNKERENKIHQFFPEFEGIKKIDEIHIEIIADACSQLLMKTSKNISKFKLNLIKLSIQGADVVKEVAILVHRSIILKFIQDITYNSIPTKAIDTFGFFLTNRIYEGWWDEYIYEIFRAISPFFTTSNFAKDLFLACIMKCDSYNNEEEKKKIIKSLMEDSFLHKKAKFFSDLVSKEPFQFIMIEILHQNNLIDLYKDTILNNFPKNSEFTKSVRDGKYEEFIINHPILSSTSNNKYYIESTQRIIKNALENNKIIIQTRNDLTLVSGLPSIYQYYTSIDKRIAYQYSAFRYQFCIRLNKGNRKIEDFIHDLIFDQNRSLRSNLLKYSITSSSSPLIVPQKLVPTSFVYDLPTDQNKLSVPLPVSLFLKEQNKKILLLKNENDELLKDRIAPSCFSSINLQIGNNNNNDSSSIERINQKIYLPIFSKTLINVTKEFKMKFDPTNNSHIFQCRFLSHYESIPCCGIFTKDDNFVILFHANLIKPTRIELIEKDNEDNYSSLTTGITYSSIIDGYKGRWELFMNHVILYVPFNEIYSCFPRKHMHLNIGLEIFTLYGCHLSFLFSEKIRKVYLTKAKPIQLLRNVEYYTKKWINNEMNNFDYLLILNTIGSRSFNDLSQYPVFPWILSDYKSEEIEIDNLQICQFRKLDKPIGIQSDDRIERFKIVYNETDPPYHYGSHYSQPACVTHFMIRIDPFTNLSLHINSGWDRTDRFFWDICESWKSVSESKQTDVKELIPEFFCNKSFLENINNLKIPLRSDGRSQEKVNLPPWAKNKPFNFIILNRMALECKRVKETLNGWIDLIFGYKQKGQPAVDAVNVYQPHCYDTNQIREKSKEINNEEDEINIEAENSAMLNFGVCPMQLFFTPHPSFLSDENSVKIASENNEGENSSKFAFENLNLTNSEIRMTKLRDFPKSTWMVRYDASKKDFSAAFKNEIFLNLPEKVIVRGNYIITINSPSTATLTSNPIDQPSLQSSSSPLPDSTQTSLENNSPISPPSSSSQQTTSPNSASSNSIIRFNDVITGCCSSYSTRMTAFSLLNGCINIVRKIDTPPNDTANLTSPTSNSTVSSSNSQQTNLIGEAQRTVSSFGVDLSIGSVKAATNTIASLFCPINGLGSNSKQIHLPTINVHEHVVSMSISEKHFILAAATKKNSLILFDVTSGRFMKCLKGSEKVDQFKFVVFDDSSNLILSICEKRLAAFSLSLDIVASFDCDLEMVTAVGVSDPSIWCKKPFFFTGHQNGKCFLWEVDIFSEKISKKWEIETKLGPIVVVEVFYRNKAVLLVDENGESVLISLQTMKSNFLNKNLFVNCACCNEKLEPKKSFICGSCGLAVCMKCYNKKSGFCNKCQPTLNKTTDL